MSRIEPISVCPAFASAMAGERRTFAESLAATNLQRQPAPPPVAYDLVLAAQNEEFWRSKRQTKPAPNVGRLIDLMA